MKKIFFSLILVIMLGGTLFSQKQFIRGSVIDKTNGEPLIGATVLIVGTTNGTMTDFDGNFSLEVETGTYDIKASFISYKDKVISGVEVTDDITELDISLGNEETELDEVVVSAKANKSSEAAVLVMKKKSAKIIDGVSADEMSKLGDGTAAAALRRVTGVSVQGGKYVFVRGLGDRYSRTTLNGAEVPGLDPEKNSVQMDLFPSNVIDNVIVNKTFSPDMPAESTGGHIDIVTRDFPDKFTLQFSSSFAYNPQANLNPDFITGTQGKYDWLGFDGGQRGIPEDAQELIDGMDERGTSVVSFHPGGGKYGYTAEELADFTTSFSKEVYPVESRSFLDHGHKFSVGNQISLGGEKALGFIMALNYSRSFEYFDDGEYGQYKNSTLDDDKVVSDRKGQEDIKLAGLGNVSLKLNNNHKIGLRFFRNQAGTKVARFREGSFNYESAGVYIQERSLGYLGRSLNSGQFYGKHTFPMKSKKTMVLNWFSSYTRMGQNEPDARFFVNLYEYTDENQTEADFRFKTNTAPNRIFNDMAENDFDNQINFKIPLENISFKIGGGYLKKIRYRDQIKVELLNAGSDQDAYEGNFELDGTLNEFLSEENIITADNQGGMYYIIDTENNAANSYDSNTGIISGFAMADWKIGKKLRLTGGMRYENSSVYVKSKRTDINREGGYEGKSDILPSLNITYELINDMNLRAAVSQTLARPQFKEIAPTSFYDYKRGMRVSGNPELQPAKSTNLDFRWDYYMKRGELIAVSAFYKKIQNAIEMQLDTASANYSVKYINTDEAILYGIEAELRKYIAAGFSIGGNFTYVKSVVELTELEQQFKGMETRPMLGQAPFVLNTYLSYNNQKIGLSSNIAFNTGGKKLFLLTSESTPYIYEQARPDLNFNISKNIGSNFELELSVDNILDSQYNAFHQGEETDKSYLRYSLGRSYGFSVKYFIK